jgi:type VI secretion system protein ImpA
MIEIAEFAKPLAGEKPAGDNMEYDQSYLELETLAAGQGAAEGEGPDWKHLAKNCRSLWEKTRDLRVASYLTIAETALGGVKELAAGLKVIHFLIKEMWDTVYPVLDPDDDNDPTERINIFSMLSPEGGAMNDPIMFINRLRETKLIPPLGYTIRDLLIAQGEIEPLDGQSVDLNLINGELMGIPLPQVTEQVGYIKTAKETIEAICQEATGKMSGGNTLTMTALAKETDKLIKFFNTRLAAEESGAEEEGASETEAGSGAEAPSPTGAAVSAAAGTALRAAPVAGGAVNMTQYKPQTRADALLLLKKVIDYYQHMEPNSPIPLLLDRALSMAQMNFLELLENMVPEAVSHGKDILGASSGPGAGSPGHRPAPPAPAPAAAQQTPAAAPEPAHLPRVPRTPRAT